MFGLRRAAPEDLVPRTPSSEMTVAAAPRFEGRVGLLAGSGRFPIYFAEAAKQRGLEVVCVGLLDNADPKLKTLCDRFVWVGIGRLGGMIRAFRRERIECVVMAGKVQKAAVMFAPWRVFRLQPDLRMVRMWFSRRRTDNKDDSILLNVIDEFGKDGLRFASALEICPELLVKEGIFSRRKPTAAESRDIQLGWRIAREMGRLDVGQSVAVKEMAVVGVEAVEGTDQLIRRAGQLCRSGGFTLVKVAKPNQDMRFDVPTIGVDTVKTLHEAGGAVLAVEADRTILVDAAETIALANKLGMSLVALSEAQVQKIDAAA
ncbi:MAG: LpxI family protein [Planctomycetia bacterium]